ncbi:MAG: hypothetical protein J5714_04765 [Alphaproteobacteria bacterium]|nr:hypothetical protein [Alphaproteobacteria bacterium]
MKLKIKGLVFVGFAAAVFAQSASADPVTIRSGATQEDDEKTVTSRWYVDGKFAGTTGQVIAQGPNRGDTTYKDVGNDSSYVDTTVGNNVLVTGKAVAEAINGLDASLNIDGDVTKHTQKIAVYDSNDSSVITGWKIIVPDSVVAESASDIAGTNDTGPDSGEGSDLTTAQAVYDFVTGYAGDTYQPKTHVDTGQTNETLKVGTGEGQWSVIQAYDENATGNQGTTGYITISHSTSRGVYEINLDGNQIARHGVTDGTNTNEIVTSSNKLPTANAVYEYAVKQHWDSTTQANKTLVTDSNGVVTVSTVPTLPGFGDQDPCKVAGVHCALVTNYDTTNGISFEWTVMAQ